MVFDVTEHQAVLTVFVDEVAHPLRVIELRFAETTFDISDSSCPNLLNEPICIGVDDQEAIVGGICHDEELRDALVRQRGLSVLRPCGDYFARVTHILPKG